MINVKLNSKNGDDEFEKMRLFCALRHFPELRTSLAATKQVDIKEPHSRIKSIYTKPKENENFKLGYSNRNTHKVLKNLAGSVLAEVPNHYGPVRSDLRQRREEHRQSMMSHKQSYNDLSRPVSSGQRRPVEEPLISAPTQHLADIDDPLHRVGIKLNRAGISLTYIESHFDSQELRDEVSSCGLLAVLGMPQYLSSTHTTPHSSPRGNAVNNNTAINRNTSANTREVLHIARESSYNNSYNSYNNNISQEMESGSYVALLRERLEVILCIRVDSEELSALYEALYIRPA